ncbi:uncharacterized protein LOC112591573 [Melanaphis sacchari]|uniref:uncharacterized protein LOC112591573 n=1 Tax=Melanaphis sacchari TaxID=742174 RepID=UPI000DC13EA3|nr:uncharacterized protein LOC112591573 [Melanaphis sacchari]
MVRRTVLLLAIIAVQSYLAFEEVRSIWFDDDYDHHYSASMNSLSMNAINAISTLLTVVFGVRLRRIQHSLSRMERSLQTKGDADGGQCVDVVTSGFRSIEYRAPAWLALAVVVFGYLKYGMLMKHGRKTAFRSATVALLSTISIAGNYYVTLKFVDHVYFAKRVLNKLNVQIMDTLGSISASFLSGFSVSTARLAYLEICDVCTMLTKTFQTQLFINIVGNVFGVTFMMLSAFNTLMSDGANNIRITLYFLYESLIRTLQMYFIIDACHTTVEQANIINITFQKKINEYNQVNLIKKKIQLFILEMVDHKIEFVIYGFICLDFEMFVSIIGTIATYFLILVQLGSSPDVLVNTSNITTTTTPIVTNRISK